MKPFATNCLSRLVFLLFLFLLFLGSLTCEAYPVTNIRFRFLVNGQEIGARSIISRVVPIQLTNHKMASMFLEGKPLQLNDSGIYINEGATGRRIYECALRPDFSQETSGNITKEIRIRFGHPHREDDEERLHLEVEFTKTAAKLEQIRIQQQYTQNDIQTLTHTFAPIPEKITQEQMTFGIYPQLMIINRYRLLAKEYFLTPEGSWLLASEPPLTPTPTPTANPAQIHPEDPVYLTLIQGSTPINIRDLQTIVIERKPFAFRFPLREYDSTNEEYFAACFACSKTNQAFQFKAGLDTRNASIFSPGQGMAAGPGGYDTMLLKDSAHHYIMYNSKDQEEQRANFVRKIQESLNEVEWLISSLDNIPIEKSSISKVYIAFYYDKDLDQIIDEGEYCRFTLQFKK